jgi:predicted DCC family thiol-disulfide oxidoreductase YuxK
MSPEPRQREIVLVYDKECPLCDAYCRMVRIRQSVGELKLVDARGESDVVQEITRLGLDIDQGMVVKVDDVLYYGSDAIHVLSMMSSGSGVFNRLNHWIFRSRARSLVLYPLLRDCRNLLLKLLRKTKVNNLQAPGAQRF